ncbi:cysteine protease [Tulasnella sp. 331]|nr:cysteine protease [Tulasnella sp. 331]KAG8888689.1 cysteine protease [Tulasnella sp. 332]
MGFSDQLQVSLIWSSEPTSLATPLELWVLLTQHVTTSGVGLPFTALNVIRSMADRSLTRQDMLELQTAYTDSMHTLCRVVLHREDTRLSLMMSRDVQPSRGVSAGCSLTYTVSLFSNVNFHLMDSSSKFRYSRKVNASFTSATSGGHSQHRTFMRNHQYSFRIPAPLVNAGPATASKTVAIRATIEASRDLPLNLSVVWGNGVRITELNQGDIQLSTGPYSYGIATSEGNLRPGIYTLIASTFEPGRTGPFSISIEGETPIELEPIAQEGAGMYSKVIRGCWRPTSTASGSLPWQNQSYVKYNLQVARKTTIFCRLQSVTAGQRIAISFSVFSSSVVPEDVGPQITSGSPHSDRVSGVASEPTLLPGPATYIAVVSAMDVGAGGQFEFTTYSSACPIIVQAVTM